MGVVDHSDIHLDPGVCTRCGMCSRLCPAANITMSRASGGFPSIGTLCEGCLTCVNRCHAVALHCRGEKPYPQIHLSITQTYITTMTSSKPTSQAAGRKKIPLLALIFAAIILGIGAGYIFPVWLARIFITFNAIFSQFLGFIIPLLILGLVTPAIIEIGNRAGENAACHRSSGICCFGVCRILQLFHQCDILPVAHRVDSYIAASGRL